MPVIKLKKRPSATVYRVEGFYVECPNCGGFIDNPLGKDSQWKHEDVLIVRYAVCQECGLRMKVPRGGYEVLPLPLSFLQEIEADKPQS